MVFVIISDTLCGRLMCNDDNQSLKPDFQHELSIYSVNHNLRCRAVVVNVGMNDVDPGMTPNGAKCGENKVREIKRFFTTF